MNSEMYVTLPVRKLFIKCVAPAVVTSVFSVLLDQGVRAAAAASCLSIVFGTLIFPVAFLFILTPVWGLNGVWLMASVSGIASGVLTLIMIKTMSAEDIQA